MKTLKATLLLLTLSLPLWASRSAPPLGRAYVASIMARAVSTPRINLLFQFMRSSTLSRFWDFENGRDCTLLRDNKMMCGLKGAPSYNAISAIDGSSQPRTEPEQVEWCLLFMKPATEEYIFPEETLLLGWKFLFCECPIDISFPQWPTSADPLKICAHFASLLKIEMPVLEPWLLVAHSAVLSKALHHLWTDKKRQFAVVSDV